jgi:hypothetical protein
MKVKQKIFIVLLLTIFMSGVFVGAPVLAASCGGVTTSIIDCPQQKGLCLDGSHPFEGTNPGSGSDAKTKTAQDAYMAEYKHAYGTCLDKSAPVNDITQNGIWGLLLLAINILTAGIAVVAVAGIVYGSIIYASAGGSPEQVKKAKTIILNVVVGLVAYALLYSFLNFIIPGGIFT